MGILTIRFAVSFSAANVQYFHQLLFKSLYFRDVVVTFLGIPFFKLVAWPAPSHTVAKQGDWEG